MRILITGGAGFVGSSLARRFKESGSNVEVTVFDNLRRRGSELNLADFKKRGIRFVHGDIRNSADLSSCGFDFDVMVEASAEPSVHAGSGGDTSYLFDTNLVGTKNALEYLRKTSAIMIFLSSSRVYSIETLCSIPLKESQLRFEPNISASNFSSLKGLSEKGISEDFDVSKARSLYGTSKLCSEYFVQEYAKFFNIKSVINRCGVIAGPGQFGKVDQGVFTLWVARHHFLQTLSYTGFGGKGFQVRDLLHPDDLFALLQRQISSIDQVSGERFNVGGGPGEGSVSLLELTGLCQEATGKSVEISQVKESPAVDIPWYVSDFSQAKNVFGWVPKKTARDIVFDIASWIDKNENQVKELFT